jgi:hypothetical protein
LTSEVCTQLLEVGVTQEMVDLIKRGVDTDWEKRPTAAELQAAMKRQPSLFK